MLAWALDEAIKLTHSRCGYLYFVDRSQETLRLHAAVGEAKAGRTGRRARTLDVYKAGIWADSLRLRQAVTHNEYPERGSAEVRYPACFRLQRHMSVPVVEGGRVTAVLGVGDKEEDYHDSDLEQLGLFCTAVWDLLKRRQAEGKLRRSVANLRRLLRAPPRPSPAPWRSGTPTPPGTSGGWPIWPAPWPPGWG